MLHRPASTRTNTHTHTHTQQPFLASACRTYAWTAVVDVRGGGTTGAKAAAEATRAERTAAVNFMVVESLMALGSYELSEGGRKQRRSGYFVQLEGGGTKIPRHNHPRIFERQEAEPIRSTNLNGGRPKPITQSQSRTSSLSIGTQNVSMLYPFCSRDRPGMPTGSTLHLLWASGLWHPSSFVSRRFTSTPLYY
jgi:hypothetical protein